MFLLLKTSDQPFHSHASFNVISIAGITLHTLVVARSGKPRQAPASFAVVKNSLLLTEYA